MSYCVKNVKISALPSSFGRWGVCKTSLILKNRSSLFDMAKRVTVSLIDIVSGSLETKFL